MISQNFNFEIISSVHQKCSRKSNKRNTCAIEAKQTIHFRCLQIGYKIISVGQTQFLKGSLLWPLPSAPLSTLKSLKASLSLDCPLFSVPRALKKNSWHSRAFLELRKAGMKKRYRFHILQLLIRTSVHWCTRIFQRNTTNRMCVYVHVYVKIICMYLDTYSILLVYLSISVPMPHYLYYYSYISFRIHWSYCSLILLGVFQALCICIINFQNPLSVLTKNLGF